MELEKLLSQYQDFAVTAAATAFFLYMQGGVDSETLASALREQIETGEQAKQRCLEELRGREVTAAEIEAVIVYWVTMFAVWRGFLYRTTGQKEGTDNVYLDS